MTNKNMEYLKNDEDLKKRIRTEIILTPLLIFLPLFIGVFLMYDWYYRDFVLNEFELFGELLLGVVIVVANIIFDIPFLKNVLKSFKK